MKVALITRDYPPRIGGIATHVSALARSLEKHGVEVRVFTGGSNLRTLLLPLDLPSKEYDLIHVQSSPYGAFVRGTSLVVTVHAPVLAERSHYSLASQMNSLPALILEKLTFRKARAILAVSALTKSELTGRYHIKENRIAVIGNGVDFERFASGGISRNAKRILLVTRLEPRKQIETAISALSKLDPVRYEAQIAGDGSQRQRLGRFAQSLGVNVEFLGSVAESDLPRLYGQAGVFLTTSASEGFGLSLLEAMASGCGVIASNIPTHRELLRDGAAGLIYETEEDLESKLNLLVGNTRMISQLGKQAQAVARGYTWDEVARRVIAAYEYVIAGNR